ncbi:MarC family protein [Alteromonas sp. ASW11-130]|uniref:MarC family protein n=1 Tax=Alteromonas sp. ASW11-130 TaxID=3015775 RepID=UPI002242C060|nr:NAAT family transporter [Alteromonas sp. ASW11-130]MCW8092379.1 MarC family protein [Alteromonas sp. ASW11-130]
MQDLLPYALLCFTSFFTLINPLGVMPIFMTLTSELSAQQRIKTARKALVVSFITISCFALGGQLLFAFFHISVDSFRIVGGIIFLIMGMDMLQARLSRVKVGKDDVKSYVEDISVTPLAIPMICGPGALTNAIVLMDDAFDLQRQIILFSVVFLVLFITYWVLYFASALIKLLGDTGIKVMMRLMGLIIMVIAVEFIIAGIKPIIFDISLQLNAS